MKKVFFSAVLAGVVALASCGGGHDDNAKKAADSLAADSTAKAAEAARVQDSITNAETMMREKAAADSTRIADSLAKAKGGK